MICPNCGKDTLSLTQSCCAVCSAHFIKVGESVIVREEALQKASKIVEETDARIAKAVQQKKVDDLNGCEGEVAGVVSARPFSLEGCILKNCVKISFSFF